MSIKITDYLNYLKNNLSKHTHSDLKNNYKLPIFEIEDWGNDLVSIKVTDYLSKLEKELKDDRCSIGESGYSLPFVSDKLGRCIKETKNFVRRVNIPESNLKVWVKRFMESKFSDVENKIINETLISRIYNSLGVNAIESYPCFFLDPKILEKSPNAQIMGVVSQDLSSVEGLDVDTLSNKYYSYMYHKKLDDMLKKRKKLIESEFESNLNAELLFNSNITTFITDLMMLVMDNHLSNKFVIGFKGNGHEDVVSFDFEDNNLNYQHFYDNIDGFENCPISSKIVVAKENDESLRDRLGYIKNLYLDGRLPNDCHSLFRNLQKLNLDKLIADTELEVGFPISKCEQTDRIRMLVDYNQEFMAK